MAVSIYEWSSTVSLRTLGVALNSNSRKRRLVNQITSPLGQDTTPTEVINSQNLTPQILQNYIDLYGEQVTQDAVGDLDLYFQRTQGRGFTIGGLPTRLSPLAIGPGDLRPSITAISVIGEGLAGWYMERRSLQPLARPVGESVDLIFEDGGANPTRYALIQVKATQQQSITAQMRGAVSPLLQYGCNVAAHAPSDYSCYIIGVIIRHSGSYDIMSLEINLV